MAIEWFSSDAKNGAASFYSTNITLNTIASVPLESAYRIQVGLDESKNVKTYARISSTDLMRKVAKALGIVLDEKPIKYGTTWDVKENILTIHTGI